MEKIIMVNQASLEHVQIDIPVQFYEGYMDVEFKDCYSEELYFKDMLDIE